MFKRQNYLNPITIYGTPARNDWICKNESQVEFFDAIMKHSIHITILRFHVTEKCEVILFNIC